MLRLISYKDTTGEGQLEGIQIPPIVTLLPMTADFNIKKVDKRNYLLLCNQLGNLSSVLDLASSNLVYSCDTIVELLCKKLYSRDDIDSRERISTDFLVNAIIYYNASYDYLKLLLVYTYSTHDAITQQYSREKVKKKMRQLNLEENWELALAKCISEALYEKYDRWFKNNSNITDPIKSSYDALKKANRKLRIEYQANQLKHGALAHFKRSNPANLINTKMFEDLNQYYDDVKCHYWFGAYENQLDIEETQKFLIEYHNCTASAINKIVDDIGLNEMEIADQKRSVNSEHTA